MPTFSTLARRASLGAGALLLATPAFAQVTAVPPDQRLNLGGIILHAKPLIMLVFAGLVIAIAYGAFVYIRGVIARGDQRPEGLTFLSALAAGGPLFGLFGAAYGLLDMSIGIANVRPSPSVTELAPGFAEAGLSVALGLLAGAIGVVGYRHLTGRTQSAAVAAPAAPEASPAHHARATA